MDALFTKKPRKLRILQRYDELKTVRNVLRQSQLAQITTAPLVSIQLSGIVLKPDIFGKLCDALKGTLTELLISGVLCNPPDFDQYISAIGMCIILFISNCLRCNNWKSEIFHASVMPSRFPLLKNNHKFFKIIMDIY